MDPSTKREVRDILTWKVKINVKCNKCKTSHDESIHRTIFDNHVHFNVQVTDLKLKHTVTHSDDYPCAKCNSTSSTVVTSVETPPQVAFTSFVRNTRTTNRRLNFKVACDDAIIGSQPFFLSGIVFHHGVSVDAGHFSGSYFHLNKWLFCDDSCSSPTKCPRGLILKDVYALLYINSSVERRTFATRSRQSAAAFSSSTAGTRLLITGPQNTRRRDESDTRNDRAEREEISLSDDEHSQHSSLLGSGLFLKEKSANFRMYGKRLVVKQVPCWQHNCDGQGVLNQRVVGSLENGSSAMYAVKRKKFFLLGSGKHSTSSSTCCSISSSSSSTSFFFFQDGFV